MRRFITAGPALIVLLVAAVALIAAPNAIKQVQLANISAKLTLAQNRLDNSNILEQLNAEVSAVGDAVLPSTVHLRVDNRGDRRTNRPPFSNGSGWVYDEAGHIVTNAHVVAQASNVTVEFMDGRVAQGTVIGLDNKTDIAVVKVDPREGLFPVRRASGRPLVIGERVYAFGSPFGIKFSMTEGIVSGLGRSEGSTMLGLSPGYTNYIQTDAAINPGNSGGPLVDINGRLVGMNTAIANAVQETSQSGFAGQSAGIGFAVPLETIERFVSQLIDEDLILRGYLGVQFGFRGGDPRVILERRGFTGDGVLIGSVPEGQPAAAAGFQPGDIITAIDGRPTPTPDILRSIIAVKTPGTEAEFTVVRAGEDEPLQIPVRLGAAIDTGPGGAFLTYIPGSEEMTPAQVREFVRNQGQSGN